METSGSVWKKILYFIGVTVCFAPLVWCMAVIHCRFYGWLILLMLLAVLVALGLHSMGGWSKTLCLLLLFGMVFCNLVYSRPNLQVSFSGTLAREGLGLVRQQPSLQKTILEQLEFAAKGEWCVPAGYGMALYEVDSLPIEILRKASSTGEKAILQFHGGGYQQGLTDRYRQTALLYCELRNGADVVNVDYRLAPAHPYPAALEDGLTAWNWLLEQGYLPENIVVAGDGTGGNLALALTAKLRDRGQELPRALICMSPVTDFTGAGNSYRYNQEADPFFAKAPALAELTIAAPETAVGRVYLSQQGLDAYVGNADRKNVYLSPLYGSFVDFPPMLVQVGTCEAWESDAVRLCNRANQEGVRANLSRYEGMFQGFQINMGLLPESLKAWSEVQGFLKLLDQKNSPF